MPEVTTRILPLPVAAAMLIAAAAAVACLYRRDRALVSPAAGRWLLWLRAAEALLLVLILADPVKIWREAVLERGQILVVVDSSRSFSLSDTYRPARQIEDEARALGAPLAEIRESSRRDLARRALAGGWLDDLRRRFRVTLYSLARELKRIEGDVLPAADGEGTDLARPLAEEAAQRARERLSGILLFTDGNHHAVGDPREAARSLALLGAPLVAVAVGSSEKPPDLELQSIDATGKVFSGDEVKVQVTIAAAGLPALEVAITVWEEGKALKTLTAEVPAGDGLARIPVAFPAGAPGRKKLTFSFPQVPGEVTAANNSRDLWLEVLSEKARVLLLDGAPRWEERYLRGSWSRDKNVELSSFLVTPPPERRLPSGFPRRRADVFTHDVIVLGDVEPSLFAKEEIESLRDFVTARGGTLVILAGEKSMPYRWAATPLAEVFPMILLDPAPSADLGAALARDGLPLSLTPPGEVSEIARLVPGRERNLELWGLLPQPRWLSPCAGLRPGAEAIVTSRSGPVFVTHAFGAGRTFYAAIDSTWRWRYRFGDELFRRFWGQVVRWGVSNRLGAADDRARLGTDSLVYETPARVSVEALVSAEASAAEAEGRVDAVITRTADGKEGRLRLDAVPRSGGRYRGTALLEEIGIPPAASGEAAEYRVHLDIPGLPGYSARGDRASAAFVVEPAVDLETRDLASNAKLLEEIAAVSGGKLLPLSRFREAADLLPDRGHEEERVAEDGPWDHPIALAVLLLGALAAEWIVRKRNDLV